MTYFKALAVLFLLGFFLLPGKVFAFSLDYSQYTQGQPITVTCDDSMSQLQLYDITDGTFESSPVAVTPSSTFGCSSDPTVINIDGVSGHTYTIVELFYGGYCYNQYLDDCLGNTSFEAQINFTIGDQVIVGGGAQPVVQSLHTDKSTYTSNQAPVVSCKLSASLLEVYDITDGEEVGGGYIGSYPCGDSPTFLSFATTDQHTYGVVEISKDQDCSNQYYDSCRNDSYSHGFVSFSVSDTAQEEDLKGGITSYRPEVHITAPASGDTFSHTGVITYAASDQNDSGNADERARLGLTSQPVSIYYSDAISEWDHSLVNSTDKILIARDLSNSGSYNWDIKNLVPGVLYRIIVDAVDMTGTVGEDVSGFFTVDYDAPQFSVTADPPATRGADVTITVNSSKDLKDIPRVVVTQHGGKPITLAMKGSGAAYVGTYKIIDGFDGIADIAVSGTDHAGNTSSTIVSGGTFAVGVDAPPKPRITTPTLGTVLGTSTVAVTGTTRNDTTVILKVNGVDIYTAMSSHDGTFAIPGVRLQFDANHGNNTLTVVAKDRSGVVSESASVQVKFNKDPLVSAVSFGSGTLGGTVPIDVAATDANNDLLEYTFQVIPLKDFTVGEYATSSKNEWVTIGDALPSHKFSWDSTEVEDGSYMLRVIVSDGTARIYSNPQQLTLRNTLPYLRFEDGRKTIVGTTTAKIIGRALTPDTLSPRPTIGKVEYSIDGGKKWLAARIENGAGTAEVRFSVTLTNLSEGESGVIFRTLDSRKLYGRASHPVVVDHTAPAAPVLSSFKPGQVITNNDDSNPNKDGVQITLTGRAEPLSIVTLSLGAVTYTARTNPLGAFVFTDVSIATRGANTFVLSAADEAGNTSGKVSIATVFDNTPLISFIDPKPSTGLTGEAQVRWRITDEDSDPITFVALGYRQGSGAFIPLKIEQATNSFVWDVSHFAEGGNYELRLQASDGIATSSETIGFYIDKTPPTLSSLTLASAVLGKGGVLKASGTAADALSGVEYVEYAISNDTADNAQKDWLRAIVTRGYLQKTASYSVENRLPIEDGSYVLSVRAVDAAGNTSPLESQKITIDTSAPRIGSLDLIYKGVHVPQDEDGVLHIYSGREAVLAVSLEDDTKVASAFIGTKEFPLALNIASGLWEGTIKADDATSAPLYIDAEDVVGNAEHKQVGSIASIAGGSVMASDGKAQKGIEAEISIFVLDETGGHYIPFASASVPDGSITSDADGRYELTLPTGSYELVAHAPGFKTVAQKIALTRTSFVGVSFSTEAVGAISGFVQGVFDYLHWGL